MAFFAGALKAGQGGCVIAVDMLFRTASRLLIGFTATAALGLPAFAAPPAPVAPSADAALPAARRDDVAVSTLLVDLSPLSPVPLRTVSQIGNIRISVFRPQTTLADEMHNLAFLLNHGDKAEGFEWKAEASPPNWLLRRALGAQGRDREIVAKHAAQAANLAQRFRKAALQHADVNHPSALHHAYTSLGDSDFALLLGGAVIVIDAPEVREAALKRELPHADGEAVDLSAIRSAVADSRAWLTYKPVAATPWVYELTVRVQSSDTMLGEGVIIEPSRYVNGDPDMDREPTLLRTNEPSPVIRVKDEAWRVKKANNAPDYAPDPQPELGRVLAAVAEAAHVSVYCEISPYHPDLPGVWTRPDLTSLNGPLHEVLNRVARAFG